MKRFHKHIILIIQKTHLVRTLVISISISIFIFSCSQNPKPIIRFSITESAGITRNIDFVEIRLSVDRSYDITKGFCIKENNKEKIVLGQVLELVTQTSDDITYTCLFPVSINANATNTYDVLPGNGMLHNEQLSIQGANSNLKIENAYFIADLTDIKTTPDNSLGSGQLAGLVLKQFQNQLLQRSHINMHWAPNFQREGLSYKTFGHILNPDTISILKGPYYTSIYKSGFVEGYEEIQLTYKYQFYAGIPYFIFSSEIKMEKDVELMLLRNDEMTMDSLFTHVMYLHPDGLMNTVDLYENNEIKKLTDDPIRDDAIWLCFYNDVLKYGFGSVRLEYDNTNIHGEPSPLYKEHTKITTSSNNGRYWNRRLIHDHSTTIPAGSRYYETNAYLVFNADHEDTSTEINEYHKILTNPLEIQYHAE